MSVHYHKELVSTSDKRVVINFSGIEVDDWAHSNNLRLHLYVYNPRTSQTVHTEVFDYNQTLALYNHLKAISVIRDNSISQTGKFIEVTNDINDLVNLIEQSNSTQLIQIFSKIASSNERIDLFVKALQSHEIEYLTAAINQSKHISSLQDLASLIALDGSEIVRAVTEDANLKKYAAKQAEKIFQNWLETNLWALGLHHIKKFDDRQIGLDSEADMVLESADGYIDLIELKRPSFQILSYDSSHNSYYPHSDTSKVIGQCLKYLKVLEELKMHLEREHKYKILRPRIRVIAGSSSTFDEKQNEALRLLNSGLNGIEIITYDHLLKIGNSIVNHYSKREAKVADASD